MFLAPFIGASYGYVGCVVLPGQTADHLIGSWDYLRPGTLAFIEDQLPVCFF